MTLISFSRAKASDGGNRVTAVVAAAVIALFLTGCAERRTHAAYPWATMAAVRPRIPELAPGYVAPSLDQDAPDLRWESPPPELNLVVAKAPIRPRSASAAVAPDASVASKPDPFSLVPQLSAQEVAAAQRQTNDSIANAESSLGTAKGHQLNATQADLVSKINLFLQESREAARGGDWNRARNLAKKAQVLGEELAGSL